MEEFNIFYKTVSLRVVNYRRRKLLYTCRSEVFLEGSQSTPQNSRKPQDAKHQTSQMVSGGTGTKT